MSKINTVVWSSDPHTEAKHIILRKYLDAWIPIISRYNGKVVYIDGFAGPGEYENGKPGSPLIAIMTIIEHKLRQQFKAEFGFIFIEEDKKRCNHLKDVISKLNIPPDIKFQYNVECGRFDDIVGRELDEIEKKNLKIAPTFMFIDPFGFSGVPLDLIRRIMINNRCEVLITFMYEDIIRWLDLPYNNKHLDLLFGTRSWIEINNNKTLSSDMRVNEFRNLYKKQLESCVGIKFVRSFMMVNKSNKPDYFLFFGTNSEVGLEKMKEAMWRVDKTGSYQFSDATYDPNQTVLFELEPKFKDLKRQLLNEFKGKQVKIEDLESFVVQKTEYLRSHIRKNILDKMQNPEGPEIEVISDKKRRSGTYPVGTIIKFL